MPKWISSTKVWRSRGTPEKQRLFLNDEYGFLAPSGPYARSSLCDPRASLTAVGSPTEGTIDLTSGLRAQESVTRLPVSSEFVESELEPLDLSCKNQSNRKFDAKDFLERQTLKVRRDAPGVDRNLVLFGGIAQMRYLESLVNSGSVRISPEFVNQVGSRSPLPPLVQIPPLMMLPQPDDRSRGKSPRKRPLVRNDAEDFHNGRIPEALATPEALAKLERIDNKIGDYDCKLCSKHFENAFDLANHNCTAILKVEYRCPDCDKVFQCPANLASHRRWHSIRASNQEAAWPAEAAAVESTVSPSGE